MKIGIYVRVSKQEQQTPLLQIKDLREIVRRRKWKIEISLPHQLLFGNHAGLLLYESSM